MSISIEFEASGSYALFSDPVIGTSGGKCSLPVPTYETLKGLCCSIYRNPSFEWVIDAVRIMNPILTEAVSISSKRTCGPRINCYLRDVRYQIKAHFVPLHSQRRFDPIEILNITLRSIRKGGRRPLHLGTSECMCDVKLCCFGEGEGFFDSQSFDFGMMYHGLTYGSDQSITARAFRCRMENGVICFPAPHECIAVQTICEGTNALA